MPERTTDAIIDSEFSSEKKHKHTDSPDCKASTTQPRQIYSSRKPQRVDNIGTKEWNVAIFYSADYIPLPASSDIGQRTF